MPEDLTALIESQQAAEAARLSQPGRYDGVTLENLAHKIETEAMGLAAFRTQNDVAPAAEADARLRVLSATNPRAAAALGLLNQGVPVIVPLDETGAPLAPPTRDFDQIASWFEPGSDLAGCWAGVPCGEQGDRFGLLVTGEGLEWFKKIATIHRPTRTERLMTALADRVDEMGVPGPGDDWDDEDQPKPPELRATVHARLWLCENPPVHRAVTRVWTGSLRGSAGQAAMAAGRPQEARQLSAMIWSWPKGQRLPVGRELRKGVLSLAAVPSEQAVIVMGGVSFVVRQVPGLLSPPPDWLLDELGKFAS
jgi:alkylated DNA nucleotide flippase Atl1